MVDPSERKKPERYDGPPCPHYPRKFKTEAAHQGNLAAHRRSHERLQKLSLDYRLKALLRTIEQRCNHPRHTSYRWYGAKGIKNFLTYDMIKFMWIRDGADKMTKPSVDRESADDNYEFSKCCFRELKENQQRGWKGKKTARKKAIRVGMKRNRIPKGTELVR